MKKILLLILLLFACALILGCVSNSDFEALEKRVSDLEKQMNPAQTPGSVTGPSGVETDDPAAENNSQLSFTYYINDMTADEVVSECKYYFDNIPAQGDTYESYYAKLKARPVETLNSGCDARFYDTYLNEQADGEVITEIRVLGTQREMDGTIGYDGNQFGYQYGVEITMFLKSYEKASAVYDKLFRIIVNENYKDLYDSRNSTHWSSKAMFRGYFRDFSGNDWKI